MWLQRPRWRWLLSAAILLFVGLQVLRTETSAWRNRRQLAYDPAVRFLREQFDRSALIMGDAGLVFGLGPDWNVLDDVRLGHESGKRAQVVVLSPTWDDRILMMEATSPAVHAFVSQLMASEYREVYNHGGYRILVRHPRG
jgi:hypothetical protein